MLPKLLPVKSDIVFRMVFADDKDLDSLIAFLQSVLRLPKEDYNEIEVLDPHLLPEFAGDKMSIIDVKLRTKGGEIIHIEIQLKVTPQLRERIVFYDAKLITEQLGSGEDYEGIHRVISVVILNEKLLRGTPQYHHRFTLSDLEAKVELTDLVEIHTLELSKLPKNPDGTPLYDWARFIATESEEELTMLAQRNPQVGKAVVKLRELSADEIARDMVERREKARRDQAAAMKGAREEGERSGERKGRREGKREEAISIAKKMLAADMPMAQVVMLTGLTAAEVEALRP